MKLRQILCSDCNHFNSVNGAFALFTALTHSPSLQMLLDTQQAMLDMATICLCIGFLYYLSASAQRIGMDDQVNATEKNAVICTASVPMYKKTYGL